MRKYKIHEKESTQRATKKMGFVWVWSTVNESTASLIWPHAIMHTIEAGS